ncbi:entericidin A/B family lipoprotein [Noviherbaspirillum sp.]
MFTFSLSACNTMKGMGKDVERGGEKMQGAAERQQQK